MKNRRGPTVNRTRRVVVAPKRSSGVVAQANVVNLEKEAVDQSIMPSSLQIDTTNGKSLEIVETIQILPGSFQSSSASSSVSESSKSDKSETKSVPTTIVTDLKIVQEKTQDKPQEKAQEKKEKVDKNEAKIHNTPVFRDLVVSHALLKLKEEKVGVLNEDFVQKSVLNTCLRVDSISASTWSVLLVELVKQVHPLLKISSSQKRKLLSTVVKQLFISFVEIAFADIKAIVPEMLKQFVETMIDSFLVLIIKDNGSLVQQKKLDDLLDLHKPKPIKL